MEIRKMAVAGSLESSDVLVTIKPKDEGIELKITSIVEKQFLDKIEETAYKTLKRLNVEKAFLHIQDRGALDCVLEARIETAVLRGGGKDE